MKTKLLYLRELLRSSFWFLPLMIILVALGLAFCLVYLDRINTYEPSGFLSYFYSGGGEAARNILSTIAGAMLAVAGTVFSIMLVVLTLASSQFGPRLLRNFMKNQLNQIVLGTYVATFIYCMLILRTVKVDGETGFTPNISITFAIFAAAANILLLITFIHYTAVSIQADAVIADVSNDLDRSIKKFIEAKGNEDKEEDNSEVQLEENDHVQSPKDGYLQAVVYEDLLELAARDNVVLQLCFKPGDFLVQDIKIVIISGSCDKSLKRKIQKAFIIGRQRTPTQDVEFAINQLTEIAARALSAAINDPFTAIACIDKLCGSVCYLTKVKFQSTQLFDVKGALRVITKPLSFTDLADAAFNQIRNYATGNAAILMRLLHAFSIIAGYVRSSDQVLAIKKHAEMVFRTAKASLNEPNDLQSLQEKYDAVLEKLGGSS